MCEKKELIISCVEVIYEVLLPWLCECDTNGATNRTLTQVFTHCNNSNNSNNHIPH
jgi:hypothetical protein